MADNYSISLEKTILDELSNTDTSLLRKIELTSKFNIFSRKEFVIIMQKMIFFFPPSSEDSDSSIDLISSS